MRSKCPAHRWKDEIQAVVLWANQALRAILKTMTTGEARRPETKPAQAPNGKFDWSD